MAEGIREAEIMGVAGGVPDGSPAGRGTPPAARIFRAHRMAGAFGGDHQHVDIAPRLDQIEVYV